MKYMKLGDLAEVISGQIMTRVKVDDPTDDYVETRRVILPRAINDYGLIDEDALAEENLKVAADEKRLTSTDDIVMKLNSPYGCARITEETVGCIVPSFCAIIKPPMDNQVILPDYLMAFLNSKSCKDQFDALVQGAVMTILSVGKVKQIDVPIPDLGKQHAIAMTYLETQTKLSLIKEIERLEKMKNDAFFAELGD